MARKNSTKVSDKAFNRMWKVAQKDPHFIKEMKAFVKASMNVYKLN